MYIGDNVLRYGCFVCLFVCLFVVLTGVFCSRVWFYDYLNGCLSWLSVRVSVVCVCVKIRDGLKCEWKVLWRRRLLGSRYETRGVSSTHFRLCWFLKSFSRQSHISTAAAGTNVWKLGKCFRLHTLAHYTLSFGIEVCDFCFFFGCPCFKSEILNSVKQSVCCAEISPFFFFLAKCMS